MTEFDWAEDVQCAVTVCDNDGVIVYMNRRSRETFNKNGESMVGKSMIPCHSERSQAKIQEMLNNDSTNCYTIDKNGVKKLIYQTPWKNDGKVAGLVEISIVLPNDMPHYIR
ncbi:MAG: PAS domain-containing protein [Muribaculaceae bacterium]|nr:PAS domain-containing protein [Muribaculaceae bacterium]